MCATADKIYIFDKSVINTRTILFEEVLARVPLFLIPVTVMGLKGERISQLITLFRSRSAKIDI